MAVRPGDETGQTGGVDPRPDRDQVIEALKAAFVQGRLGKDEFDERVGEALAAYAELDELTADIPATRWTAPPAAEEPQVTREALVAASGRLAGMLTWYDVLGVLPGASPGEVQSAYQERARLLDPRMLNGAPSKALKAADAARVTVGEAWDILQDAAARRLYDEQLAAGRNGEGLDSAQSTPSVSGGTPSGRYVTADIVIAALEDLVTPHPLPPRRVIVPDLRGLFIRSCLQVTGDLGLHVEMVQLTEHPMPVEGLVVDQSPLPGAEVRRSSTLTVEIWHPPSRTIVSRVLRISRARPLRWDWTAPCGVVLRRPMRDRSSASSSATHRARIQKSTSRAAYDHAMDLFRNVIGLFRRGAGKDREEGAAELLKEQARTVEAQPMAVGREVKREERPDPNKPGWGRTIGEEIGKARGDRASRD